MRSADSVQAEGILPNLPYTFQGDQMLVLRYEVTEARARGLVDPAFRPEIKWGRANVFAFVARYHHAGIVGLPPAGIASQEAIYAVLCDNLGQTRDRKGWATFEIVEDHLLYALLLRDAGYKASKGLFSLVRDGNRLTSQGEADLDITRKTDALSHFERAATLNSLMVGKSDHLANKGQITEVPWVFPKGPLDGYGIKVSRLQLGTLAKVGIDQTPKEGWWWESPDFVVLPRKTYPAAL